MWVSVGVKESLVDLKVQKNNVGHYVMILYFITCWNCYIKSTILSLNNYHGDEGVVVVVIVR